VLRDGPWTHQPARVDRATISLPTPEAFQKSVKTSTIQVIPLVKNVGSDHFPGWCTYSEALDSPETEVLCGGINHKTPTAAAIWRQGHLLHFGFDLSPDEMTEPAQALLINSIAYIARFTEDRPITHAPGRALLHVGADRVAAKKVFERDYVEWYFSPSVRKLAKADDWPAFQTWYKQHRDYLRADKDQAGSLVLDEEARSLKVCPDRPEFFGAMISALREGGAKADAAAKLLHRYAPGGPKESKAEAWQSWWAENMPYAFFSESGWYQWYIDPLAKKRGVSAADLRGPMRATIASSSP
jgi:hypothetical protein